MPRSDATGAAAQLASALQLLHAGQGAPSVRSLAQQVGNVSHTTVADALSGRRVPSWPVLESLVRVLGGEQEQFKQLWIEARAASASRTKVASVDRRDDEFMDRYSSQIMSHYDWIDLQEAGVDTRVSFDEVYIPQRVIAVSSNEEMDLWTLDDQLGRVQLLADHGVGGSTACRALMRRHVMARGRGIPFLIDVSEFAATIPPARSVVGHIEHATETFFQVRPPEGTLVRLLSAGRALVIFDGLADLVGSSMKSMISIIELFCREFPEVRVLVTVGSTDTQARLDPGLFAEYRLEGFTGNRIADYVLKWFSLAPNVPINDRQRLAQAFLAENAWTPGGTVNPMRLRVACHVYATEGILPANLVSSDVDSQPTAEHSSIHIGGNQARLLLVEDDEEWRSLLNRALPDYEVDMASTFGEAVHLLDSGAFDVALVDLNLVESSDGLGGAVLELLRGRYPSTRRIVVTGWPPSSVRGILERYDLDDLLIKGSFNLSDVRDVIEQAIARGRHSVPPGTRPRDVEGG